MHHLLTQVDELGVSGINGVEWDAVELPSQFMENFVWEYDVLAEMSAHEENGAPLPRVLFDKMVAAKNFQRGHVYGAANGICAFRYADLQPERAKPFE